MVLRRFSVFTLKVKLQIFCSAFSMFHLDQPFSIRYSNVLDKHGVDNVPIRHDLSFILYSNLTRVH
jgi:hypothetical protein